MFDRWIVYLNESDFLYVRENRSIDWNAAMRTGQHAEYRGRAAKTLIQKCFEVEKRVCVCGCSPVDERLAHFKRRSGINKHRDRNTDSRYLIQLLVVESEITAQTFNMTNIHDKTLLSECDWSVGFIKTQRETGTARFFQTLCITDIIGYDWCYRSQLFKWDASLWFIILRIKGVSLVLALLGGHNRHCLIKIIARDNFVVAGLVGSCHSVSNKFYSLENHNKLKL